MTMTMHSKEINRMAGLKIITMKTNQKKRTKTEASQRQEAHHVCINGLYNN